LLAFLHPGPISVVRCILHYARQAPGMPKLKMKQGISNTPRQTDFTMLTYLLVSAWPHHESKQQSFPHGWSTKSRRLHSTESKLRVPDPSSRSHQENSKRSCPHLSLPLLTNRQTIAVYGKGVGGVRLVPVLPRTAEF
jgi:hypothetical protein